MEFFNANFFWLIPVGIISLDLVIPIIELWVRFIFKKGYDEICTPLYRLFYVDPFEDSPDIRFVNQWTDVPRFAFVFVVYFLGGGILTGVIAGLRAAGITGLYVLAGITAFIALTLLLRGLVTLFGAIKTLASVAHKHKDQDGVIDVKIDSELLTDEEKDFIKRIKNKH